MNEIIRPFTAHSFNEYLSEHKLMGSHCPHCEKTYAPPRAICPQCSANDLAWVELSGNGKLAAFTVINVGPTFMNNQGFDRNNPYLTGIVELQEGVKLSARLLGYDALAPHTIKIGSAVEVEFISLQEGESTKTQLGFRVVG